VVKDGRQATQRAPTASCDLHSHSAHATHSSHSSHATTHSAHAFMVVMAAAFILFLFRNVSDKRFSGEQQTGYTGGILQRTACDLDGVDDTGLAQVLIVPGVVSALNP
jgi:hypothetical protein